MEYCCPFSFSGASSEDDLTTHLEDTQVASTFLFGKEGRLQCPCAFASEEELRAHIRMAVAEKERRENQALRTFWEKELQIASGLLTSVLNSSEMEEKENHYTRIDEMD